MSITKLHIFHKNTDATATIQGYEYQKLKTLEIWLLNAIEKKDETLYCDYEEDIFQKANDHQPLKFRQLKLYASKKFSFSSEEILKGITHFFLLFTKPDYLTNDVQFYFEANTTIAKKHTTNDANLLKEWVSNQNNMSEELLEKCKEKVKTIVSNQLEKSYKTKIEKAKNPEVKQKLQSAFQHLKSLPNETWLDFTRRIHWIFLDSTKEEAFKCTIKKIEECILALPFLKKEENIQLALTKLYYEVSQRTIAQEIVDKKLTDDLLSNILLTIDEGDNRWYIDIYSEWMQKKNVKFFNLNEFYTLIAAIQYCRNNTFLKYHTNFWLPIIQQHIELKDIPDFFKRKAIFETFFLQIRPNISELRFENLPKLNVTYIFFYFKKLNEFHEQTELYDAFRLLLVLIDKNIQRVNELDDEVVNKWLIEWHTHIQKKLNDSTNISYKCYCLEFLIEWEIGLALIKKKKTFDLTNTYIKQLIELLPLATLYNVTNFKEKLNGIIELRLQKGTMELVEELTEIVKVLNKHIAQRTIGFQYNKEKIKRVVIALKNTKFQKVFYALKNFQEVKNDYNYEETFDGYALVIANIAQIYSSLNMNLAAKYYALHSAWICYMKRGKKFNKLLPSIFGIIFHVDFKQGAWKSALLDFTTFLKLKLKNNFSLISEEEIKVLGDLTAILYTIPKITSELKSTINDLRVYYNQFFAPILQECLDIFSSKFSNELPNNLPLNNQPLSDASETRVIEWKALGISWHVTCENIIALNAIVEEFCAVLQIIQVEIAISKKDFHFLKTKATLTIEKVDLLSNPKEINTHHWKVYLPEIKSFTPQSLNKHFAYLTTTAKVLLSKLSLLPPAEFNDLFDYQEFTSNKIDLIDVYQRIYKKFYPEEFWQEIQQIKKKPLELSIQNNCHPLLKWQDTISAKYSLEKATLQIEDRYQNSVIPISITLTELKKQDIFQDLVRKFRCKGWLDWQILLGVMNHILSLKANAIIQQQKYSSVKEERKAFDKVVQELVRAVENVSVPIYFNHVVDEESLGFQIESTSLYVLNAWTLNYKNQCPNFQVIRHLLIERFNFNIDDVPSENPLKDIK